MSSTCQKLTQALITEALKKTDRPFVLRDGEVRGLLLRANKTSEAWYLEYRPSGCRPDGRRMASQSIKIGSTRSHSIAEARQEAARLKVAVADGADPAADKRARRAALEADRARATTLGGEVERYISTRLRGTAQHVQTESGALRHGLAEMGATDLPPDDLGVPHVLRMLDLNYGRACAVHRFGALNRFLDDLLSRGIVTKNVCAQVAKRDRPRPPAPRERHYSAEEIRALLSAADALEGARRRCLTAAIYLPLRAGELYSLQLSDIDAARSMLRLQGKTTKNGDTFMLPVPASVLPLLLGDEEVSGSARVFQLAPKGGPFKGRTKYVNEIRKLSGVGDFNFHDLRRTFVTTLAELGIGDPMIADALLNHRQSQTRSGVMAAYNHARLWPQKVQMMGRWTELVDHARLHGRWVPSDDTHLVSFPTNQRTES